MIQVLDSCRSRIFFFFFFFFSALTSSVFGRSDLEKYFLYTQTYVYVKKMNVTTPIQTSSVNIVHRTFGVIFAVAFVVIYIVSGVKAIR